MVFLNVLSSFLLVLVYLVFMFPLMAFAFLGVNYGQIGSNLPRPEKAVQLVQSIGASKVRIFDPDPKILKAFANTGIELIVGIPNKLVQDMQDPEKALNWVTSNIQPHLPSSKITCIVVGNEILGQPQDLDGASASLVPAMQAVHGALVKLGFDKQISVTTTHLLGVLQSSYPPSAGSFRHDLIPRMTQILNFHVQTGSPFFVNVYPYFAYKAEPSKVPLDFVLFHQNNGTLDPVTNIRYDNMLYSQLDAVYAAMAALGFKDVLACVSETGWPSKGDEDEVGATLDNASEYNGNLMKLVAQKKGTPMKPDKELSAFIFALFNEDMKVGPTSERNYGLFKPDGTSAYPFESVQSRVSPCATDQNKVCSAADKTSFVDIVLLLFMLSVFYILQGY